ncbi:uncharacterized protein LOC127590417 isoform X2 [Hippocampus zosterae]|uniref:uncharacterized protein LOC127590417 isoform X2 n=1 Tax=Hippocampus zosterae TaxID=109293 RepID=UPI00223E53D9|nr:uncharacterized protein LOC127590417 isoform X2 [Hippocampus zosterae]
MYTYIYISSSTSPKAQRRKSLMATVCFTDDFFNELLRPLHDNGPFSLSLPQSTLEVELRKPIAVSIHETGLQILINARTRPLGKQQGLIVMCEMSMKVDIKENHLVLLHGNAKCKIQVSTFWGKLISGYAGKKLGELIESKLKELVNKMVIPREAIVVVNVETTIVYYEVSQTPHIQKSGLVRCVCMWFVCLCVCVQGSLVVRGKLSLVPEVIQKTLRRAIRRKY